MESSKGDYMRLAGEEVVNNRGDHEGRNRKRRWWWWVMVITLCVVAGVTGIIIFMVVAQFLIHEYVSPFMNWLSKAFEPPVLALMVFSTMAVFPVLLLPSSPSMWIAGIAFGYKIGFLLLVAGIAMGVTLPYFIGSLFHDKIQSCLARYPDQASVIRLAGEGDFFHQFKAVVLLRLSPFPYPLFNYAIAATDVKYFPYLLGSLVGTIPDMFVSLYSGILLRTLADSTNDHVSLIRRQITSDVVGFCATIVITAFVTAYATTKIHQKQSKDRTREQQFCCSPICSIQEPRIT